MNIPIFKPQNELNQIKDLHQKIQKLLDSGVFIGGNYVETLEDNLKTFLGMKYISTLNSGSDALYFSLKALNLKKNDEVIIPSFTYYATLSSVLRVGAKPVFADIENNSFCISLATLNKVVTSQTRCIIPVNLFGYSPDMNNIKDFANKNEIYIVEDNAQGFGSRDFDGQLLGTFGEINAFSNYPSKILGGIGDGGFVATNDKNYFSNINIYKNQGQNKPYNHVQIGYNSRLDSINALVLNEKLKIFSSIEKSRNKFKTFYENLFKDYEIVETFNTKSKNTLLNYFTLVLPSEIRDSFQKKLFDLNIQSTVYYKKPLHMQPVIKSATNNLSNTELISKKVLSLPFYSFPDEDDLSYLEENITKVIKSF